MEEQLGTDILHFYFVSYVPRLAIARVSYSLRSLQNSTSHVFGLRIAPVSARRTPTWYLSFYCCCPLDQPVRHKNIPTVPPLRPLHSMIEHLTTISTPAPTFIIDNQNLCWLSFSRSPNYGSQNRLSYWDSIRTTDSGFRLHQRASSSARVPLRYG